MPGIGVISNPRSGMNKRNPRLARKLAYILGDKNILEQPDHLDGLRSVARQFKERDVDIVCINGGDGTAHTALTIFLAEYGSKPLPKIALLRGGTMNTMARNIGLKGSPESILGRVVNAYASDEPLSFTERNLLVVDGVQAGFLFGNGILSSFLEAYYEGGDASPWKAVKTLARAVGSALIGGSFIKRMLGPVKVRAQVDGRWWEPREYLAVAAGTAADIGLGFRPFFRCLQHPDHMHVLGLACPISEVVKAIPTIRLARPVRRPGIQEAVARRLILESDAPIPYMIDGDFHVGGQTLNIEVGPRLRLING